MLVRSGLRALLLLLLVLTSLAQRADSRSYPHTPDAERAAQERWGAWMQGYVVSGCLPPTSASLSLTIPPCTAWVRTGGAYARLQGVSEESARTVTMPGGDASYWLALRTSPGTSPAGWTCWPGLHYCYRGLAGNPPASDGITLLARLTIQSGAITRAGDVRPDSPIPGGPANLRSPLYGAVGDCVADDTVAIQTWINNTAWRRSRAHAPQGCYRFYRYWLNHDAVNNPGYPEDAVLQGGYTLTGDGQSQVHQVPALPSRQSGTVFVSYATDAPAVNAFAPMGSGEPNNLRGLRLSGFSVIQTTTSAVVHIDGAHSQSYLGQVFIHQQGTGDGLIYANTFLSRLEDLFVYATHASNTGIGVQVANTTGLGGVIHVTNVTGRGFGEVGVRFGSLAADGKRMAGLQAMGVQGLQTKVGLQFFGAMTGAICSGCYTEETTQYGIEIGENALGVTLLGGWVDAVTHTDATDAGIKIGGRPGTAFNSRAGGTVIQGMRIGNINTGYGIWREVSDEVDGTVIQGNALDGTAGIGIYCGTAGTTSENNLVIAGNRFGATLGAAVDATCRQGELVQTPSGLWMGRRVNLGQGLVVVSSDEIVLPTNGNTYNLTGDILVKTINCAPCTPGATITFFVQPGNSPSIGQGGNIDLDDTLVTPWAGAPGALISFLFDGTTWREQYRKAP